MNSVISRHGYDNKATEWKRLLVVAGLGLLGSLLLHGVRDPVVRYFASANIGSDRGELLIQGWIETIGYDATFVSGCEIAADAKPTYCTTTTFIDGDSATHGTESRNTIELAIFDDQLSLRGKCLTLESVNYWCFKPLPIHVEGSGQWLLRVEVELKDSSERRCALYHGIIRMYEDHNELLWLGLVDLQAIGCRAVNLNPEWSVRNSDGMSELTYTTSPSVGDPVGGKALAVFEEKVKGGVLQTKLLEPEIAITPWTPPSDSPIRIEHDQILDEVFRDLIPLPESNESS